MLEVRRAALAYSKHRDAHGLAGIQIRIPQEDVDDSIAASAHPAAHVALARSWPRARLSRVAEESAALWKGARWDDTMADQLCGQHLLQELRALGLPLSVCTTEKNLKDPRPLESLVKMDKLEMVQFTLWLRQAERLKFPARPSPNVRALEEQMAMFTEHKTEAGSVDYYAPGEEHDELVKALLMALFSARSLLETARRTVGLYGPMDGAGAALDRSLAGAASPVDAESSMLALIERGRPGGLAPDTPFHAEFEAALRGPRPARR